ncbi:MAG TPA: hypothetical protein VER58_05580 [Thermoanaerobaculia bacterium]|nr:hypothetical protein [Thermoanaerobaculia bacterium]
MHEIATIMFTGLCLFSGPGANKPYTVYLISHTKETVGTYAGIETHRPFIKVPIKDIDHDKTKRKPDAVTQPDGLFAIYSIQSNDAISFSGEDNPLEESTAVDTYEKLFASLPSFSVICSESPDECGRFNFGGTARVTIDHGALFVGTEGIKSLKWKFCVENSTLCSKFEISNDILPQRVGLHLKGSRDAIEICTNGCSSQDPANSSRSIWIKMGGQALIGSGKPDEVKQECPHAIPYKSDPDFKLYYKLRESPKGYVPIDASKQETKRAKGSKRNMRDMSAFDNRNWPEGSDCPPLRN